MKKVVGSIILLFLASLFVSIYWVAAQEGDIIGTSADNACNPGGTMAGKCDTDWEWNGGWYLARFLRGIFTREQVPAIYQSLLPPPPPPPDPDTILQTPTVTSTPYVIP